MLSRYSEPYQPTGGIAGEGVKNQLGRPDLEPLELLVREALQNSWDAGEHPDREAVRVKLETYVLEPDQKATLSDEVLVDPPPGLELSEPLDKSDRLLVVADRGTIGLAGPVRADVVVPEGEATDFVDFIRNVGQPPDRAFGAGSFGYGKGAFYLVSAANTIVVHTRTRFEGRIESRLIASALGNHVIESCPGEPSRRLTGRHWWGVVGTDGLVDPLLGDEADELALRLGLPAWEGDELGTTVAMVAPSLKVGAGGNEASAEEEVRGAFDAMGRAVSWHFWPKLYSDTPTMDVSMVIDGEPQQVPSPASDERLAAFVSAKRRLDEQEPLPGALEDRLVEIRSQRPRRHLGRLAIEMRNLGAFGTPEVELSTPEHAAALSHAALMRKAELVVKYEQGADLPATGLGYAAVFKCAEDLDHIFRRSEPPSHDDWISRALDDRHERVFVNVALRRIREELNEFAARFTPTPDETANVPLGRLSRELAGLIPEEEGPGASPRARGTGGSGGPPRPLRLIQPARPRVVDGSPVMEARVGAARPLTVRMCPAVAVMDGTSIESDVPAGADRPVPLAWVGPDGSVVDGDTARMDAGEEWIARTSVVPGAAVRIGFELDPD